MNSSPFRLHSLVFFACLALSACGGGGGSSGFTPTPAAGLYESTGGSTPAFEVLVLDSGRTYAIYGMNPTTPVPAGGVIVADTTTSGTTFSAGGARDFNLSTHTLSTGTATGTFAPKSTISGTVTYTGGTVANFSGAYNVSYEQQASLSALAGTYGGETGDLGGTKPSVVTVDGSSGALAGSTSSGCTYVGFVGTHGAGNVFDATVTFRTGCTEDGRTLRGHAFVSHNVLYVVVLSGDLSRGVLFAGVKS